jgi:hypothetical protein
VAKKKDEMNIFEDEDVLKEEDKPVQEPVRSKPASKKLEAKVYSIAKGHLYLVDSNGNGYRVGITEENKKAKIGDIIPL